MGKDEWCLLTDLNMSFQAKDQSSPFASTLSLWPKAIQACLYFSLKEPPKSLKTCARQIYNREWDYLPEVGAIQK